MKNFEYNVKYFRGELGVYLSRKDNDELFGDNWETYYYHNGELYLKYATDGEAKSYSYSKIRVKDLENAMQTIAKERGWDTSRAEVILSLYKNRLLEKERKFYLEKAKNALMEINSKADWTVLCNGEPVIENSKVKEIRINTNI